MPPRKGENFGNPTGILYENEEEVNSYRNANDEVPVSKRKYEIVWYNVIVLSILHIIAVYGLHLFIIKAKWATVIFTLIMHQLGCFGITGAAHRYWAHRSFKAKLPLRLFLIFCNTVVHENSVIVWCRNHRVHHKFVETDTDPHNAKRGFFFSHVGWLLVKKHEDVKTKGKSVDLSDLYNDPILRFQHKYYKILMPLFTFVLPTLVPVYFWSEDVNVSVCCNIMRYIVTLQASMLVNSWAHLYGNKPYDKHIYPGENLFVSVVAIGEGWHNYHHIFPWDYKTSEIGKLNWTTAYINFFAKIGWAYDLKTVNDDVIKTRVFRTGDGSHEIWGWGDKDQTAENRSSMKILNFLKYK